MTGTETGMPGIEMRAVSFARGERRILDDVTARAPAGRFTGVIGPNGSGKSTLLSMVMRWQRPDAGQVLLGGTDVRELGRREFARTVAEVEQHSATVLELSVEQIVELGTIPHAGGWARPLGDAAHEAHQAIGTLGIEHLRHRTWQTLSGGERQKVQMARALAQRPKVLVLDEPTNHLDVAAGLHLLQLARDLGLTVLAALHDLQLAAMYCDHLVVLDEGRVRAQGSASEVLTPELLADVYGLDAQVLRHPVTGGPLIVMCGVVSATGGEK